IVAEHHLNNPKVNDLVLTAMRAGPAGEKFLQTVAEKAKDKSIRGISLYILGMSYSEQADEAETEKSSNELVAKAVDYLERAKKEAPDAKVEDGTIAVNVDL